MIPITQLRAGATFQEKGEPFAVLKYEHLKLGRGTANIKVKAKNLKTGAILEKTYISGARVEEITTSKKKLQYLYQDDKNFYFMDPETFEQHQLAGELLKDQTKFLKEETLVDILFWSSGKSDGEEPLAVELPPKMKFKVSQTTPGVKGDSASNVYKDATLENGLKVKIPLFIKEGEEVVVDTRTGEYVERARNL